MKVSISWLSDYVSIEMPVDELAEALTMAGLEVEAVTPRFTFLERGDDPVEAVIRRTYVIGHDAQVLRALPMNHCSLRI